ncbi:hypothetical protein ACFL3Y_01475 [Pseudomonadota bacterium]
MKRVDNGKVSLVEFLGSIKFNRQHGESTQQDSSQGQFARLRQRVRGPYSSEESQLIRSAN